MAQGSTPYVRRESMFGLAEQTGERSTPRVGGYRVVRRLATGGTCDVLLAKAEGPHGFGRLVVLKLLLSKYSGDEHFARMFAREAAAYARLDHPSIVRLFDFFSLDGQLVMVLEYVDGMTLSRLVSQSRAVSGELTDAAAMFVGQRVFSAIAAAHSAKDPETGSIAPVIHRDINPTNVLLPWDGHAKITDFGIAKVAGLTSDTQAGLIKGTYGYMAPEQVKGEVVTIRADVYAAAILMWELFAKKPALMRDELPEMELLRAMAEPRLASLDALRPDLDRRVREVMRVALEPDARKRLISAQEIVTVLKSVVPSDQGREQLVTLLERVRSGPDRSASPTPFVGLSQSIAPPPAGPEPPNAGASRDRQGFAVTKPAGGVTQVMNERPPLPKPEPPPRTSASTSGSNPAVNPNATLPPLMRAPQQSVNTMSAAIEAAVAAAIETMPAAIELSSDDLTSMPPGKLPSEPPDTLLDHRGPTRNEEPTGNMTRPELASLLEPMFMAGGALNFGTTSSAPPPPDAGSHPPPPETAPYLGADARRSPPSPTAFAPSGPAGASPVQVVVNDPADLPEHTVAMVGAMVGAMSGTMVGGMAGNHPSGMSGGKQVVTQSGLGDHLHRDSARHRVGNAPTERDLKAPPPPTNAASEQTAPRTAQPTYPSIKIAPAPKKKSSSLFVVVLLAIALGLILGLGAAAFRYRPALVQQYLGMAKPAPSDATPTANASGDVAPGAIASAGPAASAPPPSALGSASASPSASALASASGSASASASASPSTSASASPSAAASASPSAPASPSASPAVVASAPATAHPGDTAEISTQNASPQHRIFVDGNVVGETPATIRVPCGKHTVKIGSAGKPQEVDVACGDRVVIGDK